MGMSQRQTGAPPTPRPAQVCGWWLLSSRRPEQDGRGVPLASVNFTTVSLPFQRTRILCKQPCAKRVGP